MKLSIVYEKGCLQLKKSWLFSGIILLLTGLIVTTVATTVQQEKTIFIRSVDGGLGKLEVSGNFSQGNRLRLEISPGEEWYMFLDVTDEYNFDNIAAYVTIVDPYGRKSELEAVFVSPPNPSAKGVTFFLAKLMSNEGGLTFEKSNEKVVINTTTYYNSLSAIVNYNGFYNVSVWGMPTMPHALNLYEETLGKEYPYLFLIPVGATLIAVGVVLSAWTIRRRKLRRHLETRKI